MKETGQQEPDSNVCFDSYTRLHLKKERDKTNLITNVMKTNFI